MIDVELERIVLTANRSDCMPVDDRADVSRCYSLYGWHFIVRQTQPVYASAAGAFREHSMQVVFEPEVM